MTPPRFIPFEAMTEREQREHLMRLHHVKAGYGGSAALIRYHSRDHRHWEPPVPHTHDKRTEENR